METIRNLPTFLPGDLQSKMAGYRSLENLPLIPAAAVFLVVSYFLIVTFQQGKLNAPLLAGHLDEKGREKRYMEDCWNLLKEGYDKLKSGLAMYRMTTIDGSEAVVISGKYLAEVKNLTDEDISFQKAMEQLLAGRYSGIGEKPVPLALHVIRSDLTPGLPRLMPAISEEIDLALDRVMPPCDDWTPIKVYSTLLDIVAQVSARVFVGAPLCRNPRWQELSRDYTLKAFEASRAIKQWKPWMRPFVYRFIPELQELSRIRAEAVKFMMPVTKARQEAETKRDDVMEWMKSKASKEWSTHYEEQAYVQVQLAMAAIHTTTMGATHMLYDLLAHPQFIQPLREEITEVLAETGGYQRETMAKLKKLDSFMKESQRFNPPGMTTFKRYCLRDITLSDGTVLPKGTIFEVDSTHTYFDDERFENAQEFDAFRFYNLRKNGDKNSHQFATSNIDYLHWGQGKHACPGRFFASNEIKSILAKMLMLYEVAPIDKEAGRPANFVFGTQVQPNPTAEVLFKRRAN